MGGVELPRGASLEKGAVKLDDIYQLALSWAPRRARWSHLLEEAQDWGPAHELAHALIEEPWRRKKRDYALCPFGACHCRGRMCEVHEVAAMIVSRKLLIAARKTHLANREYNDTGYGWIIDDPTNVERACALLRRKGLWPVPTSKNALEAQLRRRFRRRSALYRPKPPRQPFNPLNSLVSALLGT